MEHTQKIRMLRTIGLLVFAFAVVLPLSEGTLSWPGLTQPERDMEQARQEAQSIVAEQPAEPAAEVAAAKPKKAFVKRKNTTVAQVPAPMEEEPTTAGPTHYMLRDRHVQQVIARIELEE